MSAYIGARMMSIQLSELDQKLHGHISAGIVVSNRGVMGHLVPTSQ
jgi:hypothetical protein